MQSLHSTRRLSTHLSWVLYTELVARCIFILGFLSSWEQTEKVKPNILNTFVSWVPPMPVLLFVVLYIYSSSCAELRMYMTQPRCLEGTDGKPRCLYLIYTPHIALALNNHILVLFALGFFISKQSQQHNEFLVLVQ